MRTADDLKVQGVEAYDWPVTYRWLYAAPWGLTQSELTVNVPALRDNVAASGKLGYALWERSVAAATTGSTVLQAVDFIPWRFAPAPLFGLEPPVAGLLAGIAAPRAESGCLVMHTGHLDRLATRRLPLPGIPYRWIADRLVTVGGRQALEAVGQLMIMGMGGTLTGSPMTWLVAYPGLLEPTISNPSGVAFRTVEYLRVQWHTMKAPEPSSEPWP